MTFLKVKNFKMSFGLLSDIKKTNYPQITDFKNYMQNKFGR